MTLPSNPCADTPEDRQADSSSCLSVPRSAADMSRTSGWSASAAKALGQLIHFDDPEGLRRAWYSSAITPPLQDQVPLLKRRCPPPQTARTVRVSGPGLLLRRNGQAER